jgi:hypothetical protein
VIPIPFLLRRGSRDPATFVYNRTEVNGLVGMDEDGLVLQYREKTQAHSTQVSRASESEVRIARIPLGALRRSELRGRWLGIRLILFAADLQAFEPFRSWLRGSELVLTIPRAERAAAADLVSSIELALSTRLLYPGG